MAISAQLSAAKAELNTLQSRLASNSTDLSNDPQDPDLQILASLKERLSASQSNIETIKGVIGPNNPKMLAELANQGSVRKQMSDATEKMRQHLKERIDTVQGQIASLQAEQTQAQKALIAVQGQRSRLEELQRDLASRSEQLAAREKELAETKLKTKLTFSEMTVLDKAVPPIAPAFPQPIKVMGTGIGAGLFLGLLLTMLAEALDRRVRFPIDLEYSAAGPFLGHLEAVRRARGRARLGAPGSLALRPA
jgi:uncharacterized protein involved in exopolysaccharide biosynthesis